MTPSLERFVWMVWRIVDLEVKHLLLWLANTCVCLTDYIPHRCRCCHLTLWCCSAILDWKNFLIFKKSLLSSEWYETWWLLWQSLCDHKKKNHGIDSKKLNGRKKNLSHLCCSRSKMTTIGNEWEIRKNTKIQICLCVQSTNPIPKSWGTLYKLWIKTECHDVEVSNFNIYSEYNIDDISNV